MWPESNRAHFMAVRRRNTLFAGALKTATKIIRRISVHHRDSTKVTRSQRIFYHCTVPSFKPENESNAFL